MTKASDNIYPKVLLDFNSSNPAAPSDASWKMFAKADGVYARSSNTVLGPFGGASSGDAFYSMPTVTNYVGQYQGSSTTNALTVTAPATTDKLIAVVYSTGRGANSISQTNVTWTQRYTGNGNSQYLEVWTGVASSTGGTTATFNFTGSNNQFCEVFTVNSATSAFTAGTAASTATGSATALATVSASGTPLTEGAYVIFGCSAAAPSSSYGAASSPYRPLSAFGGQGRGGITRINGKALSYWSLSSSAVNFFTAIVVIS